MSDFAQVGTPGFDGFGRLFALFGGAGLAALLSLACALGAIVEERSRLKFQYAIAGTVLSLGSFAIALWWPDTPINIRVVAAMPATLNVVILAALVFRARPV